MKRLACSLVLTLSLAACGDDPEPKGTADNSAANANTGSPDAGNNTSSQDGGTNAGTECGPNAYTFEGDCYTRAFSLQGVVDSDELGSLTGMPLDPEAGSESSGVPLGENCTIETRAADETPELPNCYDVGLVTVSADSAETDIELTQADNCYSIETGGFASSGEELTFDFAGGNDLGALTLTETLPETPVIEATETPSGGFSFVASNPPPKGFFVINFFSQGSTDTSVNCLAADGQTLELSADERAEIVDTLGGNISGLATYAWSQATVSEGTYLSLSVFSYAAFAASF